MKKLLSLCFCLVPLTCFGQYADDNSTMRKALVLYELDNNGFYKKKTNVFIGYLSDVVNTYAYDKKNQNLYVQTNYSNCVVTLTKDFAKKVKKDKSIPQMNEAEVSEKVLAINAMLENQMNEYNLQREKHLADSITKAKADSIAKAKADSLEKIRQDSIERETYRREHDWHIVPINGDDALKCDMCEDKLKFEYYLRCLAIKNDSIYYMTTENAGEDIEYTKYHVAAIPYKLKTFSKFSYHLQAFSDSIEASKPISRHDMLEHNLKAITNALDKFETGVRKEYPFGFVSNWSWNDKYSNVTLYLSYFNTNKKTIKYIDVHFKITNAVGDVRKTGVFKGTGPVESFDSGTWDWDSSRYYVAGDATNMELTQIVLTFMDGTKKVLSKNQIKYK